MSVGLKEVEGNVEDNEYVLRPYGVLLMALGSDVLAQRACDALALHMRRWKQAVHVEDEALHFSDGLDDEDFAIIRAAILWHNFTDPELKKQYEQKLIDAVQAAREKTWARRREEARGDTRQ